MNVDVKGDTIAKRFRNLSDITTTSGNPDSRKKGKYIFQLTQENPVDLTSDKFYVGINPEAYKEQEKEDIKKGEDAELIIFRDAMNKENDKDFEEIHKVFNKKNLGSLSEEQKKEYVKSRSQGLSVYQSFDKAQRIPYIHREPKRLNLRKYGAYTIYGKVKGRQTKLTKYSR